MSDQELLEKFANPETRNYAFNLLIRKYQHKVYSLIRKMVIDHSDADDLTQETFIKVWQHLAEFRGDSQLFTWIYRIASNETFNFLNKKRRRFFLPLDNVDYELEAKIDADPQLSGDEIQNKLQKAILRLPEKQRLVFHLRYYDEMPYEQMSEVTGTSEGALKASYHHAVRKIEEFLNGN
ncbi:RNA polymerase subunit sigma [Siphonobacter sp. BAB-5385]|uniref:RNA polymerase sigma factor n=1 Tax=unclassified Siphonobacter TaxID=2635712 RepID=UPI000B9EBC8E|nr:MULTISPECIES: sigma-70 family RNA polymerase sigma factor [unclassified Siphonobacter]OZI06970.1 RNA polymerase subunit sigma [Siphonobacter sp. BAB-5385]PMD95583.1 RNA polymerase subunit sigma [Siphonobacter sp. BAB-5405]